MSRVLVTGANGFVGAQLCRTLSRSGREVRGAVRKLTDPGPAAKMECIEVGDIEGDTQWGRALERADCVVHLASRVHVMGDRVSDPLAEYRKVNVEGTLALGRQAIEAGIKRFVFVSSIKVNGESTKPHQPFTAQSIPAPLDPYGVSKSEAEQGLRDLAATSGMEVVIVRPPLVYGPGVKANFLRMMQILARGIPLPLGAIRNQRSLVALDNLVDLLVTCIDHPAAANKTFLVSDNDDLSTPELLRRMARALGKTARLVPVPDYLLVLGSRLIGKHDAAKRLLGSLQVDITHTCSVLDWAPPVSTDEGLAKTARHFLEQAQ